MSKDIIVTEGVTVSFGDFQALKGIDVRIKQGEIIGYVGSSGLSTGPHLHYEIIRNGEKINPSKFAKNTSNIYLEGDDLQGFKKEYNRIIQLMKDY